MCTTKLKPTKCTFQRCIDDVYSARRSSARRRQTMVGVLKSYFVAKCSVSGKLQEISPKLLLMSNRKLHMRFRLSPRSMTLNSIGQRISRDSRISQITDATTATRMKIDQNCQRQRCKHIELEQFVACFRVARVCQRQLDFLVSVSSLCVKVQQ